MKQKLPFVWVAIVSLHTVCGVSCTPATRHQQQETRGNEIAAEQLRTENTAEEAERAAIAAAEAALIEARAAKMRDDSLKIARRHCMSKNEMDAYLWVKKWLVAKLAKNGENIEPDVRSARARAEIAAARAFGLEPANWAKRDYVDFVENDRNWKRERDEVNQRWRASVKHAEEVNNKMMRTPGSGYSPSKSASLYWYQRSRDKVPNNPYAIAMNEQRRVEREREAVYRKYGKETPEERLAGVAAILLFGLMGEFGAAELGETDVALASLGEAEAAMAVGESEVALASVMEARATLIAAEEGQAALVAVEEAQTALTAGQLEQAAVAVQEARSSLTTTAGIDPATLVALAALNEAESKLDAIEKADVELGVSEKIKIDQFNLFAATEADVTSQLASDQGIAYDYARQYKDLVRKGKISQSQSGDVVMRRGCQCKSRLSGTQ